MIARAMTVTPFPGINLRMSEQGAKAILGSPNGVGVAYLLFTHKEQFGHRTVESVRVWRNDNLLVVVFKIVPVTAA
jgi:hypothetical protein